MDSQQQPVPTTPASANIDHTSRLCENFLQLHDNQDYTDLTLLVEGERIPVHKCILAAQSQYFRALLFGGLKESAEQEVELKDASLPAFKELLKYIYTGRISLVDKSEEVILDILKLANVYAFQELENSICDYVCEILSIRNVCWIYDAALSYGFESLPNRCLEFMEKHATALINEESFLELSYSALNNFLSRDSFCVPEIRIFTAVKDWLSANPDVDRDSLLSNVKLNLIPIQDLYTVVLPSKLISAETILDAIGPRLPRAMSYSECRNVLCEKANVADPKHGAIVLQGEMQSCLLMDIESCENREEFYTRHMITDTHDYGIIVKLGTQRVINHVKMLLWEKDERSYSYYLEISVNQEEWERVIDYREYHCRSWQRLYFEPRAALYIRIVGTKSTVGSTFYVRNFQVYYKKDVQAVKDGFVVPSLNVATIGLNVTSIFCSGVQFHCMFFDERVSDYIPCSTIRAGIDERLCIVQLSQPYMIGSMQLSGGRPYGYSYSIKVSRNSTEWELVANETKMSPGWQTIRFHPKPVVYILIAMDQDVTSQCLILFECPAPLSYSTN